MEMNTFCATSWVCFFGRLNRCCLCPHTLVSFSSDCFFTLACSINMNIFLLLFPATSCNSESNSWPSALEAKLFLWLVFRKLWVRSGHSCNLWTSERFPFWCWPSFSSLPCCPPSCCLVLSALHWWHKMGVTLHVKRLKDCPLLFGWSYSSAGPIRLQFWQRYWNCLTSFRNAYNCFGLVWPMRAKHSNPAHVCSSCESAPYLFLTVSCSSVSYLCVDVVQRVSESVYPVFPYFHAIFHFHVWG